MPAISEDGQFARRTYQRIANATPFGAALTLVFVAKAEQLNRRGCDAVLAGLHPVIHRKHYAGVFCLAVGEAAGKREYA